MLQVDSKHHRQEIAAHAMDVVVLQCLEQRYLHAEHLPQVHAIAEVQKKQHRRLTAWRKARIGEAVRTLARACCYSCNNLPTFLLLPKAVMNAFSDSRDG